MRFAATLAAGAVFTAIGLGMASVPVSAAPGIIERPGMAASTVEQIRLTHRHRVRRGGRRVMGLPTPGSRGRGQRLRVPRI